SSDVCSSDLLPEGVFLGARPYPRPLARTRDEHDRFVLALLSQERSRFFISQIGPVKEVFQANGERTPRLLADSVAASTSQGAPSWRRPGRLPRTPAPTSRWRAASCSTRRTRTSGSTRRAATMATW